MDGRGIKDLHKCGEEMSKNSSLPSQEQQEISELNGSGGERGKGIRGPKSFVPVGDTNRDKRGGPFVPVGVSNRDKRPLSPAAPASRWTRDKNHLLSQTQRLPELMAWNIGLFYSSGSFLPARRRRRRSARRRRAEGTRVACVVAPSLNACAGIYRQQGKVLESITASSSITLACGMWPSGRAERRDVPLHLNFEI